MNHRRFPLLPPVVALLLAINVLRTNASAEVLSPRVVHVNTADPYDLSTLTHHPLWSKLEHREYAETVLKWLQRRVALISHGPTEGTDKVAEFAEVLDPLKTLSVYGYGDRRALCSAFVALWETSGRGRGRLSQAKGEFVAELEFNGEWHAFDVASGSAAAGPTEQQRYHAAPTGHSLGFALRRGERFTRWWQPQGDRWQLTEAEAKNAKLRKEWQTEPRGPKANGKPVFANGQFVYEPLLQGDAADFQDGVYDSGNVEITAEGLTLTKPGEGFAIFDVHSPYILVADVGKLEDPKDNHGASVVELEGTEITAMYSRDYGATWLSLDAKKLPATLDLSAQVGGTYGYLLRVDFKGKPGGSVLKALKITSWVQVAPGLLPEVQPGQNTFRYLTGDAQYKPTLPVVVEAPTSDENGFLRPVIRPPREFHPGDAHRRVIGPFTARVTAPPGQRIAWFTVGGSFACDPNSPQAAEALLGYAFSAPTGFLPIETPRLPSDHASEHYHIDVPVPLEMPVPTVYLRGEGRPALNQFRVTLHCVNEQERTASPLVVTHRWRDGDALREHQVELAGPQEYTFDAGAKVVNESVEFRVPGGK